MDNDTEVEFKNISTILKNNFHDEMGAFSKTIIDRMDLSDKEKDGMINVSEYVEHLDNCDNENCEIHKSIKTKQNNSYMRGFLLGAKFGKQKKN